MSCACATPLTPLSVLLPYEATSCLGQLAVYPGIEILWTPLCRNAEVSNTFKVDLHALHVDEAMAEMQKTIQDLSRFKCKHHKP